MKIVSICVLSASFVSSVTKRNCAFGTILRFTKNTMKHKGHKKFSNSAFTIQSRHQIKYQLYLNNRQ